MTESIAEGRTFLNAFNQAITRETHNLSRWPEMTWQQLHNRLQWQSFLHRLLELERRGRSMPGFSTWAHARTPFREALSLVRTLQGHRGRVLDCAPCPHSPWVVSAGSDATLKVWDIATGECLRTLHGHIESVHGCAVAPDGSFLVSASSDATLKLWDPATEDCLGVLEGHTGPVLACAVAPDASFVVSVSSDGTVKLWDPTTRKELHSIDHVLRWPAVDCAVSGDGRFILAAFADGVLGYVKTWELTGHEEIQRLEHPSEWSAVDGCAVSPTGNLIVSAGKDNTLKVWDSLTGAEVHTLTGHRKGVSACAVSPDETFIVSAGGDSTLRIWDLVTGEHLGTFRGHGATVNACAVSPEGRFIVSASDDGTLKIWDAVVENDAATTEGHTFRVSGCSISSDGSFAVSVSQEAVKIHDGENGLEQESLPTWFDRTEGCAISPDGSFLVTAGWGLGLNRNVELVVLRHLATGWEPDHRHADAAGANDCAVAPDGTFIVSAGIDGSLRVWEPPTTDDPRILPGHTGAITACDVTPDGHFIISASADATLRVWDRTTGEHLQTFAGHTDAVLSCAVSPDARLIASGGADHVVKIWDRISGEELRTLKTNSRGGLDAPPLTHMDYATGQRQNLSSEPRTGVTGCAVSPDGALVISTTSDGILRAWNLDTATSLWAIPLLGRLHCVAVHPWRPRAVCGDEAGGFYLLDFVGIEYGPIIITAIEHEGQRTVRCPKCWQVHPLDDRWVGQVTDCPTPTCDLVLRVNPFALWCRGG